MKLYGFPLSPFVRKVAVAAAEKGLDYEWEPSNPQAPTEEFLSVSPFSKIPGFADGDYKLADSTAITIYLDAKYPEPALIPADPEARGRAIWFEETADSILVPAGVGIVLNRFLKPVVFGQEGDEDAAIESEKKLEPVMDYLERQCGDGWLDGAFSIGDIAIASVIKTLGYGGWTPNAEKYPRTVAWYERVCARDAWEKVAEQEAAVFAGLGG
jgi:glutathione S-transferase